MNERDFPEVLIPPRPDLEYLVGVAENPNLPAHLRGNLLAAVRYIKAEQERVDAAVAPHKENAERWAFARGIFSWEDVSKAYKSMRGFESDPAESEATDQAIDIARQGGEIEGDANTGKLKPQGG